MKAYKINANDLSEGIKKVLPVVPDKSPVPILKTVLLRFGIDEVEIIASNLAIQCSTFVELSEASSDTSSIAISPKEILKVLKDARGIVAITVNENHTIDISIPSDTGNNAVYHFSGLSGNDFPIMENKASEPIPHSLPMSILSEFATIAGKFVSDDDLKIAINHIYFEFLTDSVCITATDAHSLYHADNIHDNTQSSNFLADPVVIQVCRKMFSEDGIINIRNYRDSVSFDVEGNKIFFRKPDAMFPGYRNVIPNTDEFKIKVPRTPLNIALDRIKNVSNSLTHHTRISIDFASSEMMIQSEDIESGKKGIDYIDVEIISNNTNTDTYEIGMDCVKLARAIEAIKTDYIVIRFGDPHRCILIEPEKQLPSHSVFSLMMPLMLDR